MREANRPAESKDPYSSQVASEIEFSQTLTQIIGRAGVSTKRSFS
jgi:hypothetical protein